MKCRCDDKTHPTLGTTLWHRAYCNWHDRKREGHNLRAGVWGWVADRLVRWA